MMLLDPYITCAVLCSCLTCFFLVHFASESGIPCMTPAGARKLDAWTHLGDGMMGCVTAM